MSAHVTSLAEQLTTSLGHAITTAYPDASGADPLIRPSDHADLQANAALALAKKVGAPPRDVAAAIVDALAASGSDVLVGGTEISGPGFINLTVSDAALWGQVEARLHDERLGVPSSELGTRTVVDYSAPNIAKEMHVGHLRSTIIGDALVRVLEFLGGQVVRQNHLGDWGTQFGMLITYIDEHPDEAWRHTELSGADSSVSALDNLYRKARREFDGDPAFAERSRTRVVALQAGDEDTLTVWKDIVSESEYAFDAVYRRLGVRISSADSAGESTYNAVLESVARELEESGVAVISDGALVVLSDEIKGRDGEPAALIIRKSDGGYGYGTTDMATIRHRVRDLHADRILYVVGAPQAMHFRQIFEAARRAGWLTEGVEAVHVPFGSILGADGRPFKSRSGDTVRLAELLDDAVEAAATVVREGAEARGETVDETELARIAEQAGIGAIKYADLSGNRVKDYTFDPERMVSFTGNTGVYLQYAHTRMTSILRKAVDRGLSVAAMVGDALDEPLTPQERALVLTLDGFGEVLGDVVDTYEPHKLATYLYETARTFTEFYEACPVLAAEGAVRQRRLALVDLTRRTVGQALELLGIAAPDRM